MPIRFGDTKKFLLGGINYELGMMEHPSEETYDWRAELWADGVLAVAYEYTWDDVEEDIWPDPEDYARRAIQVFNEYLAEHHDGEEREYDAIVNDFFLTKVVLVGYQLVEV